MKTLVLDGKSLTIPDVYEAATVKVGLKISPSAQRAVKKSRNLVEEWVRGDEKIYGVTTGFGDFSNVKISLGDLERLQENLIVSHAAGTDVPLPQEIVRAMIILRANTLVRGYSGVRLETINFLCKFFEAGIVPVIPSRGSVGSSGDLVQLAHLVLTMIGKGKVWYRNDVLNSAEALKKCKLKPLTLKAKEGLALVNGTQMMAAFAALIVYDAVYLCTMADIATAMSLEALKGSDTPFDARIHQLRPHNGQQDSASNLRALMINSEIRESHRYDDPRVQDAYSLRCAPQVQGASRDAIHYARNIVTTEINSVTDNPLIFPDSKTHLEGGNFHGQPLALALDFLGIALSELANISERRIERMVNGKLSGLPRFLSSDGGLNSGMMIAQYTAASLVSENKVLAHPASVDSIPTSANQEDHNSMGSIGALKCWQILKNVQTVLAIELMVAAQGIDFSRIHPTTGKTMMAGRGVQAAYNFIRKHIRHVHRDRVLYDDIQVCLRLLKERGVLRAVERAIGKLK
jgi:histidine ammonia-lyase